MNRRNFTVTTAAVILILILFGGNTSAVSPYPHLPDIRLSGVEWPGALAVGDNTAWAVLATRGDDRTSGNVFAYDLKTGKKAVLMKEGGCYGPPTAIADGDQLHVAVAQWEDDKNRIILASLLYGGDIRQRTLSFPGHNENPSICVHAGQVLAAWETHSKGTTTLSVVNANKEKTVQIPAPTRPGCCYRPKLASDGASLFLIFEHFFNGRYHLECCVAKDLDKGFGLTTEVGYPDGNDMAPTVAVQDGSLLVAWENSLPLQRGWTHAVGNSKITIPGFGHGWRVETKMGLRRVRSNDGRITIEDFTIDNAPEVKIDPSASAGCPRVIPLGNRGFALVYLTLDGKLWRLAATQLVSGKWQKLDLPELLQDRRVSPTAMAVPNGGRLLAIGSLDATKPKLHLAEAEVLQVTQAPEFISKIKENQHPRQIRLPRSAPSRRIVEEGKSLQLFWGDLHMHTNISRCSLSPLKHCSEAEEKYCFSRDVGGLDFAMITDHAEHTGPAQWQRIVDAADRNYEPGFFVSFVGFEWTSSRSLDHRGYGHYNVLYRDHGPEFSSEDEESDTPNELWAKLPKGKVITIPHHPAQPGFVVDWSFYNPDYVRLVEIFQVRGSYEYPGCPMSPADFGRGPVEPEGCVRAALKRGHRFGFTSGGEHEGVGITAVFAEELTRDSIFDALYKRHVYGTTGDRIFIVFRVNGKLMGSEISFGSTLPEIDFEVVGTSPISSATLVRNGEDIKSWTGDDVKMTVHWIDRDNTAASGQGEIYYYLVVQQQDGEMAWTSPVFISSN